MYFSIVEGELTIKLIKNLKTLPQYKLQETTYLIFLKHLNLKTICSWRAILPPPPPPYPHNLNTQPFLWLRDSITNIIFEYVRKRCQGHGRKIPCCAYPCGKQMKIIKGLDVPTTLILWGMEYTMHCTSKGFV